MVGPGLVLIGFRGAGKTTIGRLLASRTGARFSDTDQLVEARLGLPILELWRSGQAARFRAVEGEVIAELGSCRQVVSTGGGAILDSASRERLSRLGPVVWLNAEVETLAARLAGSDRPSLTGAPISEEIGALLLERTPLYSQAATAVVWTDGRRPEEICDELQQLWRDLSGDHLR